MQEFLRNRFYFAITVACPYQCSGSKSSSLSGGRAPALGVGAASTSVKFAPHDILAVHPFNAAGPTSGRSLSPSAVMQRPYLPALEDIVIQCGEFFPDVVTAPPPSGASSAAASTAAAWASYLATPPSSVAGASNLRRAAAPAHSEPE